MRMKLVCQEKSATIYGKGTGKLGDVIDKRLTPALRFGVVCGRNFVSDSPGSC